MRGESVSHTAKGAALTGISTIVHPRHPPSPLLPPMAPPRPMTPARSERSPAWNRGAGALTLCNRRATCAAVTATPFSANSSSAAWLNFLRCSEASALVDP